MISLQKVIIFITIEFKVIFHRYYFQILFHAKHYLSFPEVSFLFLFLLGRSI